MNYQFQVVDKALFLLIIFLNEYLSPLIIHLQLLEAGFDVLIDPNNWIISILLLDIPRE